METDSKTLIHRSRRGDRLVEIFDRENFRYLYFNTKFLQSKMALDAPHLLVLPYTRYMMLSLMFLPHPKRILLIGLGAGSLLRYLSTMLPNCKIDAVDHSQEVIDLACGYFKLPETDNVSVYCRDGVTFLENLDVDDGKPYDIILLDAFDELGIADVIYNRDFFTTCRNHLTEGGTLCSNLWSGSASELTRVTRELAECFAGNLTCPVPNRGNVIAYSFKHEIDLDAFVGDSTKPERLQARFELDFRDMKQRLIRHNF
jgi:spermidine synthase